MTEKLKLKEVRAKLATIALRLHQPKILVADRKRIGQELLTQIIPSLVRTRKIKAKAKLVRSKVVAKQPRKLGKRQTATVLRLSKKRLSGVKIANRLGIPRASVLATIRENRAS